MNQIRNQFLPYVVKLLAPRTIVILSRDWKPLGMSNLKMYVCEDFAVRVQRLAVPQQRLIDYKQRSFAENDSLIALYADECRPTDSEGAWQAFSRRLAVLSKVLAEPIG